jgi:hypothetical protein
MPADDGAGDGETSPPQRESTVGKITESLTGLVTTRSPLLRVGTALAVLAGTLTVSVVATPPQPASALSCTQVGSTVTCVEATAFGFNLTIPNDIVPGTPVTFTIAGQTGESLGSVAGGRAAQITAAFMLTPGTTLSLGRNVSTAGGGRSDVVVAASSLPLIVAGGGGGAGGKWEAGGVGAADGGAGGDAGLVSSGGFGLAGQDGHDGRPNSGMSGGEGGFGGTAPPGTLATCCAFGGILVVPPDSSGFCTTTEGTGGVPGAAGANFGAPVVSSNGMIPGRGGGGWVSGGSGATGAQTFCLGVPVTSSGAGGGGGGSSFVNLGAVPGSISASYSDRPSDDGGLITFSYQTTNPAPEPLAEFEEVLPDPRNTAVTSVGVTFNQPVTGLSVADFTLERDGSRLIFPVTTGIFAVSATAYRLIMPASLTDVDGAYTLTLRNDGTVVNAAGLHPLEAVTETFRIDRARPQLSFAAVETPRTTAVPQVNFTFSEPITGSPTWRLTRDGEAVDISSAIFSSNLDRTSWQVGVGSATAPNGTYEFTVSTAGVTDLAGNSPAGGHSISWVKADPLTATIGPIEPQLRSIEDVTEVPITFNRPVTGFELGDLVLTRDGQSVSLSPPVPGDEQPRLVGSGASYVLERAAAAFYERPDDAFPAEGVFELRLPVDAGIVDDFGLGLSAEAVATVIFDRTFPTYVFVPVDPNPRETAVESIVVVFSEPVSGVDATDFRLLRNGERVHLDEATLATDDGITYTIGALGPLTNLDGDYEITLPNGGAASGIVDRAGNGVFITPTESWSADVAPTATFSSVQSPRATGFDEVEVIFSEPVTGVDVGDFRLFRQGPVALTGVTLEGSGANYTLRGLGPLTSIPNEPGFSYALLLVGSPEAGIFDATGHQLASVEGSAASLLFEVLPPPSVSIDSVTPELRNAPLEEATVRFSRPVTGFDAGDLVLRHDGGDVDTSALTVTDNGDGDVYTIGGLDGLTTVDGGYELSVEPAGSDIRDIAVDLALESGATVTFTVDGTAPSAEIGSPDDGLIRFTGEQIRVLYTCADNESGIAVCHAQLDDGTVIANNSDLPTDTPGVFTLTLTAVDAADNRTDHSVTYEIVSRVPIAVDDSYTTTTNAGPLRVAFFNGVLVNDIATTTDLTAELVDAPTHGTVDLATNGAFTYTPQPGFEGVDTFTYRNTAGGETSEPATVTITVTFAPPLDPPGDSTGAAITVSDDTPDAGDTITVTGTGFPANRPVHLVLYSDPIDIGDSQADNVGDFTTAVTIPTDTTTGAHTLAAFSDTTTATTTLDITGTDPTTTTTTTTLAPTTTTTVAPTTTTVAPTTTTAASTTTTVAPTTTDVPAPTTTAGPPTTATETPPSTPGVALGVAAGPLVDVDGGGNGAGDTITYTHTVTNTGNVTLTNVAVTNPLLGGTVPCGNGPLQPGTTRTCQPVTYTVTTGHLGTTLTTTATVTATTPTGTTIQATTTANTPVPPACSTTTTTTTTTTTSTTTSTATPSQADVAAVNEQPPTTSTAVNQPSTTTEPPATTAQPTTTAEQPTTTTGEPAATEPPTTTTTPQPTTTTVEGPSEVAGFARAGTLNLPEGLASSAAPRQVDPPCTASPAPPTTTTTTPTTTTPTPPPTTAPLPSPGNDGGGAGSDVGGAGSGVGGAGSDGSGGPGGGAAPTGTLPATGTDPIAAVIAALALVAAGLTLTRLTRRTGG